MRRPIFVVCTKDGKYFFVIQFQISVFFKPDGAEQGSDMAIETSNKKSDKLGRVCAWGGVGLLSLATLGFAYNRESEKPSADRDGICKIIGLAGLTFGSFGADRLSMPNKPGSDDDKGA